MFRASIGRFQDQKASCQPVLRRGVLQGRSRDSFFETCFRLGWILDSSVENGRTIGLFKRFRSRWIPLGISVKDHVLEIAGLDSRLGLRIGDFRATVFCGGSCLGFRLCVGFCGKLRRGLGFRLRRRLRFRLPRRLRVRFRSLGFGGGRL